MGIFKSASNSIVGAFGLVDNTIHLANRSVDQAHKVLDVSEVHLDNWKAEAKLEAELEQNKIREMISAHGLLVN